MQAQRALMFASECNGTIVYHVSTFVSAQVRNLMSLGQSMEGKILRRRYRQIWTFDERAVLAVRVVLLVSI